jgi:hypothetical protein
MTKKAGEIRRDPAITRRACDMHRHLEVLRRNAILNYDNYIKQGNRILKLAAMIDSRDKDDGE